MVNADKASLAHAMFGVALLLCYFPIIYLTHTGQKTNHNVLWFIKLKPSQSIVVYNLHHKLFLIFSSSSSLNWLKRGFFSMSSSIQPAKEPLSKG